MFGYYYKRYFTPKTLLLHQACSQCDEIPAQLNESISSSKQVGFNVHRDVLQRSYCPLLDYSVPKNPHQNNGLTQSSQSCGPTALA